MAIIDDAVEAYQKVHTINGTARALHISAQKVRKLLITAEIIQPKKAQKIMLYRSHGMDDAHIMQQLHIGRVALESYLPYIRGAYNQPTRSANAAKLAAWREKKRSSSNQDAD